MQLYRLILATIWQRKVWMIAVLCCVLLPLVLPYMTPYETNPTLLAPARAQAAWGTLWFVSMIWVFFQGAKFGEDSSRSGLGSYFLSSGVSEMKQMLQIWAACMSYLLPLVVIAVGVCLLGAMPSDPEQAHWWCIVNMQYVTLFLLAVAPLLMLAISLGSRFGGTIGFLVPLSLLLYGLYGVGYVEMLAEARGNAMLDWFYVLSPHYHIADLTGRLYFKLGEMLSGEFTVNAGYLAGVGLVWMVISSFLFKAKSLN